MKTINDFKIIDGVAVLEGVAYAEEAKVVDEFLKSNSNVKYASVYTKDNRHFELKDNKLFFTKKDKFLNPYYSQGNDDTNLLIEKYVKSSNLSTLKKSNKVNSLKELEKKILFLENEIYEYKNILNEILTFINNKL